MPLMFGFALLVRGCVATAIPPSLRASHTHPRMSMRARHPHSRMGRSLNHLMTSKTNTLVSGCFAEVRSGFASSNISPLGVIFGPVPVPAFLSNPCSFATR